LGYSQSLYQFTLPNAGVEKSFYMLQYDGQEWRTAEFSVQGHDLFSIADGTQFTNGHVYFQWDSTNARFELLQRNGPGGLITEEWEGYQIRSEIWKCGRVFPPR
jgi:hypothetical protein